MELVSIRKLRHRDMAKDTNTKKRPQGEKMQLVLKLDTDTDGRKAEGFKDHREVKLELTRSQATALMDKLFAQATMKV